MQKKLPRPLPVDNNLSEFGSFLAGWVDEYNSIHVFFDPAPSFAFPTDFRIDLLQPMQEDKAEMGATEEDTLIVLQRNTRLLTIGLPTTQAIQRLLKPLYENADQWYQYFDGLTSTLHYPAANFNANPGSTSTILDSFSEMIVLHEGRAGRQQHWRFCCILLPDDTNRPLQQRTLTVRACSKFSPHKIGVTITPYDNSVSLSLRSFQGGQVVYRPLFVAEEPDIAFFAEEREKSSVESAIAVPIGGEEGQPVGILYVASDQKEAFSENDQRVLRLVACMIEELLKVYAVRQQATEKLPKIIATPALVDELFEVFLTENDFIKDLEYSFAHIKSQMEGRQKEEIEVFKDFATFVAVDIDNISKLTNKYGHHLMRLLSREVGLRIQRELRMYFTKDSVCKLYHIFADRFYIFLPDISLEQARDDAERLRLALSRTYRMNTLYDPFSPRATSDSMFELHDVTVRLGVLSYSYAMIEKHLQSYDNTQPGEAKLRAKISRNLDDTLKYGMEEQGNVVMAWDPTVKRIIHWSHR